MPFYYNKIDCQIIMNHSCKKSLNLIKYKYNILFEAEALVKKIKVYYDGSCHLCSREMNQYKNHIKSKERIEFCDLSDPTFKFDSEGLDKAKANKYLHVKLSNGQLVTGIDSFVAIWKTLEICKLLLCLQKTNSRDCFLILVI